MIYTVTYTYDNPSGAGPFKGRMDTKAPSKRGDSIMAPFGWATVKSCRRKPGAAEEAKADPCDTTLDEACRCAEAFADKELMPQTVYRNAESGGWWHTNPFASFLGRSEVFCTYLGKRYHG